MDYSEERMFSDNMMLPEQSLTELQQATRNDAVLQELEKAIKTGRPAVSTRNEVLKPYLQFKDELLFGHAAQQQPTDSRGSTHAAVINMYSGGRCQCLQ